MKEKNNKHKEMTFCSNFVRIKNEQLERRLTVVDLVPNLILHDYLR